VRRQDLDSMVDRKEELGFLFKTQITIPRHFHSPPPRCVLSRGAAVASSTFKIIYIFPASFDLSKESVTDILGKPRTKPDNLKILLRLVFTRHTGPACGTQACVV
jgi:hypothetical protein